MIVGDASHPKIGVTCGDVIEAVSEEMYRQAKESDYKSLEERRKREIGESYRFNRSREHGVPGGRLGEGMRRLDFLGKDVIFGGIVNEPQTVKGMIGAVLPATVVLKCVRQYALTPEDIRDMEEQQRRVDDAGRARSRARSRAGSDNGLT
jgi:hypothetical protein